MHTRRQEEWISAGTQAWKALRTTSRGTIVALVACVALGIVGIYAASTVDSDVPMPGSAVWALVFGAIFTFIVGAGLMFLVFFSSRRGFDDAIDTRADQDRIGNPDKSQ
jgi:cell division protein FtsW (lipid II flippase)